MPTGERGTATEDVATEVRTGEGDELPSFFPSLVLAKSDDVSPLRKASKCGYETKKRKVSVKSSPPFEIGN